MSTKVKRVYRQTTLSDQEITDLGLNGHWFVEYESGHVDSFAVERQALHSAALHGWTPSTNRVSCVLTFSLPEYSGTPEQLSEMAKRSVITLKGGDYCFPVSEVPNAPWLEAILEEVEILP